MCTKVVLAKKMHSWPQRLAQGWLSDSILMERHPAWPGAVQVDWARSETTSSVLSRSSGTCRACLSLHAVQLSPNGLNLSLASYPVSQPLRC
jgi:hypothetical protein